MIVKVVVKVFGSVLVEFDGVRRSARVNGKVKIGLEELLTMASRRVDC